MAILLLAPAALPAGVLAAPLVSSELSFFYTSGKYGTTQTTETMTTTALLGYSPNNLFYFELSAPYIYSSHEFPVLAGDIITDRRRNGTTTPTGNTTSNESQSGPGDVLCSAYLDILAENRHRPMVSLYGKIKLPTADEEAGLGTGETDIMAGAQTGKWLGRWHLRAEGAHVFQGENKQLLLKDYFTWETGVGYLFGSNLLTEAFFRGATEPADGVDSFGEFQIKVTKRNNDQTGFSFFAATGLGENSFDYGLGWSVFANF